MQRPNEMTFDRNLYDTEAEMWKDIAEFIEILLRNKYICTVRDEECGIYVIHFELDDETIGTPYPYWIVPSEYEKMICNEGREDGEVEADE